MFGRFWRICILCELILLFGSFFLSREVQASFISSILGSPEKAKVASVKEGLNSQNMPLLHSPLALNPDTARSTAGSPLIEGNSLVPQTGPTGGIGQVEEKQYRPDQISLYVVRKGDTLSEIAEMFGVSPNTIIWQNNDIVGGKISPGQTLVILPVSGVNYIVKKEGETVDEIAKTFKADVKDILDFNDLVSGAPLSVGDPIIIPDGELETIAPVTKTTSGTSKLVGGHAGPDFGSYFIHPLVLSHIFKTQGLHGFNGVDIKAPVGTAVRAAAAGTVIISKTSGWNGGYGDYIAVMHENGTETLYAHLSKNLVKAGDHVDQGDIIGESGMTGKTTGPHLHYEVRGGRNPEQDLPNR